MAVRLEMKSARPLRNSPEVIRLLERYGRSLVTKCNAELGSHSGPGAGYSMSSQRGVPRPWGRHRVTVAATGTYAKRHDAIHQTLIRHAEAL